MGVYERIFAFVLQNFTFGDASGLLPDHDLTPENLDSLNRITQFVTRKLAALAPQAQARSA